MVTSLPSTSASLPPPAPTTRIAPERRIEPGRSNIFAVAGGLLALMILLMAVQAVARHDLETTTSEGGLSFVIPLGASATLANPAMDSAIAIPTRIVFKDGEPAVLTIRNADTAPNRAGPWVLGPGQTYTVRFDQPGTYAYACTMNPAESVTVIVEGAR